MATILMIFLTINCPNFKLTVSEVIFQATQFDV